MFSAMAASRAQLAFDQLQSNYWQPHIGFWSSSMWWQTANTIETLCNFAELPGAPKATITELLPVVFAATSNATRARCDKGVDLTFSGYIDDMLWWGIAWLRAFQVTANRSYLGRSVEIFDDATTRAWLNDSCGGGVCWQLSKDENDMHNCYKNAITNELFLALAGGLALHHPDAARAKAARSWVARQATWFLKSGLINGSNLVNDGLDTFDNHWEVCMNNRATAYTYNQGVILSGLASAWLAAKAAGERPDDALLQTAVRIIDATWASHLVHSGTNVLREMGEAISLPVGNLYQGAPGGDGLQFKGVLIRHLAYFVRAVEGDGDALAVVRAAGGNASRWRGYVGENADSIWAHAACVPPTPLGAGQSLEVPALFGFRWTGPCSYAFGGPTATSQTAAIDVFVAQASLAS